jgi:hypothetical protein
MLLAPGALQRVVDAFALRGYHLHIMRGVGHPHSHVLSFHHHDELSTSCEGASAASLYDLKAVGFTSALAPVVHYAVFAHDSACDSVADCAVCPVALNPDGTPKGTSVPHYGQSGVAEFFGNDLIVSLANFINEVGNPPDDFNIGGTFMHELGHNLGLHHSGGFTSEGNAEDSSLTDYKPNFLSVMNYNYQFVGIPTTQGPRLDYSTLALRTLDESALDESVGLGGAVTDRFYFIDAQCHFQTGSASGPVDWDGDGTAGDNAAVIADLNPAAHVVCGSDTSEVFLGHVDWPQSGGGAPFTYAFQCTSLYGDGASAALVHEQTPQAARAHHVARRP